MTLAELYSFDGWDILDDGPSPWERRFEEACTGEWLEFDGCVECGRHSWGRPLCVGCRRTRGEPVPGDASFPF